MNNRCILSSGRCCFEGVERQKKKMEAAYNSDCLFSFLLFLFFFSHWFMWKELVKGPIVKGKISRKWLRSRSWEDTDYQLLFEQTGLTKEAVDAIREKKTYQIKEFLRFQKAYLGEWESECCSTSLFTKEDRLRRKHWKSVPLGSIGRWRYYPIFFFSQPWVAPRACRTGNRCGKNAYVGSGYAGREFGNQRLGTLADLF